MSLYCRISGELCYSHCSCAHRTGLQHTRWSVALQQAQQLDGQPRRGNKVVRVVLEVDGRRGHDLDKQEQGTHQSIVGISFFLCVTLQKNTHPAEPGHRQ